MSLVDYSSSSDSELNENEESDTNEKLPSKKLKLEKSKLPLPSAIKNLSNHRHIDEKPIDNPDEHEGRHRSFEHERGNWASFAYVPIDKEVIDDIQQSIKEHMQSQIDLKLCNEIHISVTKTIVLRHHWIQQFIKAIRMKLEPINEFLIELKNLKVYCNEERTRTFIGIQTQNIYTPNLIKIMEIFNGILDEYRLEKFYEDPSFHASVLWCLGDQKQSILNHLEKLQEIVDSFYLKDSKSFLINVNSIHCKIGNKLYKFNLNKK